MKTRTVAPAATPKLYETENDISQDRRAELNALMNQRLADAVDLQMQMKQAHWNVKGPHFIGLHELFDQIDEAEELEDADTADIFTEVSRGIDKWLWFVEAHTQATK